MDNTQNNLFSINSTWNPFANSFWFQIFLRALVGDILLFLTYRNRKPIPQKFDLISFYLFRI